MADVLDFGTGRARTRNTGGNYRSVLEQQRHEQDDLTAPQRWAAGLVVPRNITLALDMWNLFGPEVDTACHAAEPDVDNWEAGKLYPRWDQMIALAELTKRWVNWFTRLTYPVSVMDTSIRFHMPRNEPIRYPVVRYPDDVVARCPGTDAWKETHRA